MSNPFFINNGPFKISEIFKILNLELKIEENLLVKDIQDLYNSDKESITFFHSKKYNQIAKKTKASYCITTQNLKDYLPKNCTPIVVENVLISTSLVTQKFYPNSIEDEYDASAVDIKETTLKDKVTAGKNVLVGDLRHTDYTPLETLNNGRLIQPVAWCNYEHNSDLENRHFCNHHEVLDWCFVDPPKTNTFSLLIVKVSPLSIFEVLLNVVDVAESDRSPPNVGAGAAVPEPSI